MYRVGIITKGFLDWNGGVDFVCRFISALLVRQDVEIFIFVYVPGNLKKYQLFKRIWRRIRIRLSLNSSIPSVLKKFESTANFVFFGNPRDLRREINSLSIDFLLPSMEPNLRFQNCEVLGYLYDCQHRYFPEFFSKAEIDYREKYFRQILSSYRKIFVNASTVKTDLIKFYNANKDNIVVLPFAPIVDESNFEMDYSVIEKYGLPEKYYVVANQFWVHKDHETVFRAFAKLALDKDFTAHLVCTGLQCDVRWPNFFNNLKSLIDSLGISGRIHFTGLIPKKEQLSILRLAIANIQPTLFEGGPGGGSVWDSIAFGQRSIVSDIQTNLELNSDLVTFFKAHNVDDLCEKIKFDFFSNSEKVPSTHEQLYDRRNYFCGVLSNFLIDNFKDIK